MASISFGKNDAYDPSISFNIALLLLQSEAEGCGPSSELHCSRTTLPETSRRMFPICSQCKKEKRESTRPRPALRLSKGLVNQEGKRGLQRVGLTARISSDSPSHKFMDTNDFMVLSALLRNLAAPKLDVICRAAPLPPGRVIDPALQGAARRDNGREKADRPLRIQPRRAPKTAKNERNVSQGETKRFARRS
jgi:hypothetical protein